MVDSAVIILVQDNLDIACAAIEKAAMEQAVADVDDGFRTSYEVRGRHREVCYSLCPSIHKILTQPTSKLRTSQPFWDQSVPHSSFTSSLPDPLRIKPSGVQPLQAAVYEDFGNYLITYATKIYLILIKLHRNGP